MAVRSQTKFPNTVVDDPSVGDAIWDYLPNAKATDGLAAECNLNSNAPANNGRFLMLTDFGLTPAGKLIGMQCAIRHRGFSAGGTTFAAAHMVKGGARLATNLGNPGFTQTLTTFSWGGATNTMLGQAVPWTLEEIRASGFGLGVRYNGYDPAYVDSVAFTIYYETPPGVVLL